MEKRFVIMPRTASGYPKEDGKTLRPPELPKRPSPPQRCGFLPDHEGEDDHAGPSTLNPQPSTGWWKRRPWRCRWPEDLDDEVLARLLKSNRERAQVETLAGLAATAAAHVTAVTQPPSMKPSPVPAEAEVLPVPQNDLFR